MHVIFYFVVVGVVLARPLYPRFFNAILILTFKVWGADDVRRPPVSPEQQLWLDEEEGRGGGQHQHHHHHHRHHHH